MSHIPALLFGNPSRPGPGLARAVCLGVTPILLGLWWASPVGAEEDPPVCIKEVNGTLVMSQGPCPEGGGASRAGRAGEVSKKTAVAETPTQSNLKVKDKTPSRKTAPAVEAQLKRISLGDESEATIEFENMVALGSRVVPGLAVAFMDPSLDVRSRWVAGRALGKINDPRATDVLIAGLKDKMPLARVAAANGLKDQGARDAVPDLIEALNDPGAMVRSAAVDAIAALGTASDSAAIATELAAKRNFHNGQSLFVRNHAVVALTRLGGPDAVAALIEVVDDRDIEVAQLAQQGLVRLTGLSNPPGEGPLKERWRRWWRARQ